MKVTKEVSEVSTADAGEVLDVLRDARVVSVEQISVATQMAALKRKLTTAPYAMNLSIVADKRDVLGSARIVEQESGSVVELTRAGERGRAVRKQITAEQLSSRQLQGKYLSLIRQMNKSQRRHAKGMVKDLNREAAVRWMKGQLKATKTGVTRG